MTKTKATRKKPAAKKNPARRSRKVTTASKSTRSPAPVSKKKPTDAWRVVDRLQLSKLLGVHRDTVTHYTREGMPVIVKGGSGKRSSYDAVECVAWWRENQGKNAKENAQTRAYNAQADLNELKLKIQRGELLPRDEVVAAGQNYTKAWVAKIRALPRAMVQAGCVAKNREIEISRMLNEVLKEISRWGTASSGSEAQMRKDL